MRRAPDSDRYPWVYLAQWEVLGHVFSSYQTYLWQLSNLVTFNVLPGRFDRLRGRVVNKSPPAPTRTAKGPAPGRGHASRSLPGYASVVTSKTFDRMELGFEKLPFDPDLLLVIEVPKTISDLGRLRCKKAYYAIDVHVNLDRYFDLAKIEEYDYVFVAQKAYVEPMKERGCSNVTWLPLCADPAIWSAPRGEPKYDLTFIGNPYGGSSRDRLVSALKTELKDRMFVGQVYLRDAARAYSLSKAVLNHSRSHDLNFRVFEAMCSGSLLLTDRDAGGLLDLFEDGTHLAAFDDEKEALERLRHYLDDDAERERVAAAGKSLVMREHTYDRRLRQLLAATGLKTPSAPPPVEGPLGRVDSKA